MRRQVCGKDVIAAAPLSLSSTASFGTAPIIARLASILVMGVSNTSLFLDYFN
jgi:hypothetical protein